MCLSFDKKLCCWHDRPVETQPNYTNPKQDFSVRNTGGLLFVIVIWYAYVPAYIGNKMMTMMTTQEKG